MAFTAKDVAELRKQTGCGMMDCKKALTETDGNFEEAVKYLREKGMAATAKKADRIAAEGIVDIMTIGNTTAIVEVNSETDFVAKNATFQEFVKDILKTIIAEKPANVDALLASTYVNGGLVSEALAEQIYKIGEKLSIRRFQIVEGTVSTYIHGMGATGVVVSFDTDVADKDAFKECAKNVALQTAAMEVKYLNKESVPASVLAEEESILINQMKEDPKMANKPEAVLANIVKGRIGKFYENNCLLEQAYVKDDSMSVSKYVESSAKAFGGSIKVVAVYSFTKGEGLEKKEENFAEEIAKLTGGNQ